MLSNHVIVSNYIGTFSNDIYLMYQRLHNEIIDMYLADVDPYARTPISNPARGVNYTLKL